MDRLRRDFDDPLLLLPPIAGGDGEGDEGDEVITDDPPAGEDAGGDAPGEESLEEGADDAEQADGGEAEGAEGAEGGEEAGDELEDAAGGRRTPQSIPYSRFQEVVARAQMAERNLQLALGRNGGGNGNGGNGQQAPPAVELPPIPEQYTELDKGMGGYMRHYLNPLAAAFMDLRDQHERTVKEFRDESSFYRGAGRNLNERQVGLVEQVRESLSQKLRQPVERADALLFLRGHPKYGKLFVDRAATQRTELANGVVAARRQAGKLAGRGAVPRGRGPQGPIDLNKLPRLERIKVFEREMGNTPV